MSDSELLKCLDDTDLHVVKERKVVDGLGIRYRAYDPRDASDFTATDLKLLRQACSAACAQYGKNGLDDAAIFEKLEVYVSDPGNYDLSFRNRLAEGRCIITQLPACHAEEEMGGAEWNPEIHVRLLCFSCRPRRH